MSALWLTYCDSQFELEILDKKGKYQKADWACRPLPDDMRRYAAHDSHFLLAIALKQMKANDDEDASKEWIQSFQGRTQAAIDEAVEKFLETEQKARFACSSAMKKSFRAKCDFYDPESDEYLRVQHLYKDLYMLRDAEAREQNVGADTLVDVEALYLAARTASISLQDDKPASEAFLRKVNEQIDQSLNTFP